MKKYTIKCNGKVIADNVLERYLHATPEELQESGVEIEETRRVTNRDWLANMSDSELAGWLGEEQAHLNYREWLKWLEDDYPKGWKKEEYSKNLSRFAKIALSDAKERLQRNKETARSCHNIKSIMDSTLDELDRQDKTSEVITFLFEKRTCLAKLRVWHPLNNDEETVCTLYCPGFPYDYDKYLPDALGFSSMHAVYESLGIDELNADESINGKQYDITFSGDGKAEIKEHIDAEEKNEREKGSRRQGCLH